MVNKTYALKPDDQAKLISYASRYKSIRTTIDETNQIMTVWTTWPGNDEPSSIADQFQLQAVSNDLPKMPDDEYRRRVEGKPI
jgi:hypothetical protein